MNIKFNRNELAGSFGDIGTDLPLLLAMIAAVNLDVTSTFVMFGLMQIATGLLYGMPMPMQPLKAMAVIVISQKLAPNILYGAGFSIGLCMLFLTITGLLDKIVKIIPLHVVRGIQFGLGLSLMSLALKDYVPSLGSVGFLLAAVCFAILLVLKNNKRFPGVLIIIGIGCIFSYFKMDTSSLSFAMSFHLPELHFVSGMDMMNGFLLLGLAQLPLSLSNSVIATHRTIKDLYPEKDVSIKKIGLTYSIFNLITPWFSGVPACHGCGGLAGHYAFGGRTGGSVVIYGLFYLVIGLFFSGVAHEIVQFFPKPLLGVILFFEALILLMLISDITSSKQNFSIALIVASIAMTMPHGYLFGLLIGVVLNKLK
jgi:MFS superfamily sulfate permease-like transporter